ncbi:MAG: YggS family pyridoxal phosphate-dependent enzyme [Clostridiales Family XIII bacterium]|jgi:pyridoxal phosphate enzyme (YggS family)|nr:YggS family pyridoxal phosphate-dependent enzyme [Clostridiales Family XIII bacterium]
MIDIKNNLSMIRERADAAAKRAGRSGSDILLVAVTKTRSCEEIARAIRAGVTDVGENKVQEITEKFDKVGKFAELDGKGAHVRWHMIGHLQRNKVKYIVDKTDIIHSVDSVGLAEEIDKRAAARGRTMDVLVQVNAAGEESKFGVSTEGAKPLIDAIVERCPAVRVKGLMSIAPAAEDPEDVRRYFREVKELYDLIARDADGERLSAEYLSMGMTHDFEVAIEEGSNLIRVGTGIFGARDYGK